MRACVFTVIASLLLCTSSFGATYVVNPAGTGSYKTIQGAVTAASTGDVIELTNGVFKGPGNADVTVDKDVTVRSQCGHPASCIIDGDRDVTNGVTASANAVIDGITVRNTRGYGIVASGSAVIKNCIVTFCGSVSYYCTGCGGGISGSDQSLVTGNLVTRNRGIGIRCFDDAVVSSNVITYNIGYPDSPWNFGGGVAVNSASSTSGNPLVINNYIAWNQSNQGAGIVVYLHGRIIGNTIRKNRTSGGFGMGVLLVSVDWDEQVSEFRDNIIWGNTGTGGVIAMNHSKIHISNCDIYLGISGIVKFPEGDLSIVYDDGGNIDVNPVFGTPLHSRFRNLSPGSPCVDAGSAAASSICFEGASGTQCMNTLTAVSDQSLDTGTVDMGAHHLPIDYAYVPDQHSTIAGAIKGGHDLVIVRPGTYVENIDFSGEVVEVRSEQGPAVTEIIGLLSGDYVVRFDSGECGSSILEGFTIRNDLSGGVYAGGILCDGSSPWIWDNIITECSSSQAGGIVCLNGGNALIAENEIRANQADRGAGIRLGPGCYPGIYDNEITDNLAIEGGGLYCEQSGPGLAGTVIRDNQADSSGGGIYLDQTPLDWTLSLCTIADNSAPSHGGGIHFDSCDNTRIALCTIARNRAGSGAGLAITSTDVTVDDTILAFNRTGEAVACSGGSATLSSSDVFANMGGDWIGCIAGQDVLNSNISAHPEFCDMENGDYTLAETSPCRDFGSPSLVRIGAWAVGCTTPAPMTWAVCPDGSGDFTTIKAAIAVALEGDIIELCDGTYTGIDNTHLDYLGKAVTVRSQSDNPAACIIDCENATNGVWFRSGEGPGAVLRGVTIRRGEAPLEDGHEDGGAVRIGTATVPASPTIENCIFENCHAIDDGGAVNVDPGSGPTITDCVMSNNDADDLGGGIHCTNASGVTISGCVIENNDAEYGGGIALVATTSVSVTSCAIGRNLVTENGGAVYSWSSTSAFTDCLFYWNEAANNGGGIIVIRNSATLDRCTLYGNGGLDSGGISSYESASVVAQNTIIADSVNGAAVYCTSGTITLTCSDLHDNADGDWVGCVVGQLADPTNISEDPLFCDPMADDFTLRDDSPCLAPCGQMGALGVGCTSPPDISLTLWDGSDFANVEGGHRYGRFEIDNLGGEDLIWTSSTTESWVSLEPTGGTVAGHTYIEGFLGVDATGLDPGLYTADVVIDSNDPDEPQITIPVTMTVSPAPLGEIYLSALSDQRWPGLQGVVALTPFHWYVAVDVDFADIGRPELNGTDGIAVWEASIDVPPEITVTSRTLSPVTSLNIGSGDNFIVATGTCLTGGLTPYTVVDYGAIALVTPWNLPVTVGPASPSSFSPPEAGWLSCDASPVARPFAVKQELVINQSYLVKPDGTGDFPNIEAAIAASHNGYIINLADGTFAGPSNRDLDTQGKALVIRSQSGDPSKCIIECNGTAQDPHRGFWFHSAETSNTIIEGITITGGYATLGGAIQCQDDATPVLRNCVFENNHAGLNGGAIWTGQPITVEDCAFYDNSAVNGGGGGMICDYGAAATILRCTFAGNTADKGGGLHCNGGSNASVESCTFYGNSATTAGGGIRVGNSSPTLQNTIIAFSLSGEAFSCTGAASNPTLICCDLYGNAGGDWVGCVAPQFGGNNISEDPLFCGPDEGLYTLDESSLCQAAHSACGQVGAHGVGCNATAAPEEEIPTKVTLAQNHPNPFNPRTVIQFGLPQPGRVDLAIFDVRGRRVRHLIDGLEYPAGIHEIQWNGTDDAGRAMGSGIYIYRLESAGEVINRKMTLLQ